MRPADEIRAAGAKIIGPLAEPALDLAGEQMRYPILDHGYIELVEGWGSDERIIEAARMSTAKGFQGWGPRHASTCRAFGDQPHAGKERDEYWCDCSKDYPGDEKLLRYLWEHAHATPFEMAGMTIEVQAPIFVFREWHRHRTQSYNELSARYAPMPAIDYVPEISRCLINAGSTNRQAGTIAGAEVLTTEKAGSWIARLRQHDAAAEQLYQDGLNAGIPKELARLAVAVGRYSKMRASANLRNWLAFLTLRQDAAAQWEIRQYANAVGRIVEKLFPRTWEVFRA